MENRRCAQSLGYAVPALTDSFQAAAEVLILAANDEKLATCALRPSVLIGPGDYQLIPSIHACIAKGESRFVIGDGLNMWDVTYETRRERYPASKGAQRC